MDHCIVSPEHCFLPQILQGLILADEAGSSGLWDYDVEHNIESSTRQLVSNASIGWWRTYLETFRGAFL
jgi:hypothetical protein